MSTTLNENWIELSSLPCSTRPEVKIIYVKLSSISGLSIIESKDGDGEEQHHIFVLAQGTKHLYKTEKTYAEAEQTAKDLIATVENPINQDKQNDKSSKNKLRLVSGGKEK
jgi:hypothetical protein